MDAVYKTDPEKVKEKEREREKEFVMSIYNTLNIHIDVD